MCACTYVRFLRALVARTEPFQSIFKKRPTANLMSKKVLTSLMSQIVIQILFQGLVFFDIRRQSFYEPLVPIPDQKNIKSFENTGLFLLSCFQYIVVAIVFSVGPPYRKSLFTNGECH
jgi:cation-transporting ATPase 13A2